MSRLSFHSNRTDKCCPLGRIISKLWTSAVFLPLLAFASSSYAQKVSSASAIYGCWKIGQALGTANVYGVFYLACKRTADCIATQQPNWGGYTKIGYGHLVAPGEDFSKGIEQEEAQALLKRDSQFASQGVNSVVETTVTQTKFDAMVALAFDIGEGAFAHSELVSALNSGQAVKKADFTQFDMSNGELDNQLKQSRAADWNLFSKGKYKH